jgi:hypothetical protein
MSAEAAARGAPWSRAYDIKVLALPIVMTAVQWAVFMALSALLVLGPFVRTFEDVERYGYLADIMPSDWNATNVWLDSTDCAHSRGAWLALCESGKLVPISERAVADDPGHALLLGLWAIAQGKRATLPDVARLNTLVDAIGLLALAGLLFALRAWFAAIVLMALGPVEYLGWMGTSPHWSYIGLVSLCAVLPIALATRSLGLLAPCTGALWIASGLLFLAIASLMRESIGLMGFLVTAGTIGVLILRRRPVAPLAIAGTLALLAFATPKWVVAARDAAFEMQAAQRVAAHGMSHTLYLGLGFVENKWNIRYDDDYGAAVAGAIDPAIVFGSPEYFGLMRRLYVERWTDDPIEVMRIYLEKAWQLLATPTLYPGPPFGLVLLLALIHLAVAGAVGAWRALAFVQGLVIESVAVAFLLLFLAQAMAALPSQTYAMPANAFVLVLLGVVLEFFVRLLLRIRAAW